MARKRLGEILIERQVIDADQLNSALAFQRQWGHRLGAALVAMGFVSEGRLCRVVGEALGLEVVDLATLAPDWDAIRLLSGRFCANHQLVPVSLDTSRPRKALTCAMADALDVASIDEIEFTADCKVRPVLAPLSQIHAAVQRYYFQSHQEIPKFPDQERKMPARAEIMHATGKGDHDVVVLTEEVTDRTELAEIIRDHEERQRQRRNQERAVEDDLEYLFGVSNPEAERLEKMERRFWGLMRLLAKKGVISKAEFEKEFEPD